VDAAAGGLLGVALAVWVRQAAVGFASIGEGRPLALDLPEARIEQLQSGSADENDRTGPSSNLADFEQFRGRPLPPTSGARLSGGQVVNDQLPPHRGVDRFDR
jgi:hypothetical protein